MIVNAPEEIPAPPTPVMARPTISAMLFGATPGQEIQFQSIEHRNIQRNLPHIKLPISNRTIDSKNEILSGKYLYAFPHKA